MAFDLATAQHVQALEAKLDLLLTTLAKQPAPADASLMSVQQVADYTHFDRKTVEKWVKKGDYNSGGKLVYLRAYEFSGRLRFKRADVEAFGLGHRCAGPFHRCRRAANSDQARQKNQEIKSPRGV